MRHLHSKPWLLAEWAILMIGLPVALYLTLPIRYLLPMIWLIALGCHLAYRALDRQPTHIWWGRGAVTWANLRPILLRFAFSALLLGLITWIWVPELLFGMIRTKPAFWLLVMVFYPILSVVPQEIIFRSFFFTRYQTLFKPEWMLVLASGVAFGMAHILFHNWIAPLLCFIGGVMFARTYAKHRSLMLVAIEHALYGDFLFTLGLGRYFYHGTIALAHAS